MSQHSKIIRQQNRRDNRPRYYEHATHECTTSCKLPSAYKGKPIKVLNKVGRNAPCPCGSGLKYKRCCK